MAAHRSRSPVRSHADGKNFAQSALCGQFTDVPSTSVYCSFILEAYYTGITQGTSASCLFSPSATLPREQAVTFLSRTIDNTLHRGTVRTAMGKTWSPTSIASGTAARMSPLPPSNDIVSDGICLWIAPTTARFEDGFGPTAACWKSGAFRAVFRGNSGFSRRSMDRRRSGRPSPVESRRHRRHRFAGHQRHRHHGRLSGAHFLDGTNIWWAGSGGNNKLSTLPIGGANGLTFSPGAGISGLVFDGTSMSGPDERFASLEDVHSERGRPRSRASSRR